MKYLERYLRNVFTVDLRALAVMRIWLAGIILTDLSIRASDMEAHYSNMGILPLHVLHQHLWLPHFFSFHTLSGLWQVQLVLFAVAAIAALCLLLGYKTRVATVISWLLLLSLQNRNPLIAQGGDDLLRMLLFWGMFLPWGKYYSVDAVQAEKAGVAPIKTTYFSIATAAYILQVALVYFSTALLKNSPEWTTEGTALYYALSLDQILMPGGRLIYPYPELLRALTHFSYYTELLLPLLLLIPFYNNFFRLVVVGVLAGFHVGISLTLFVGLFYLINLASVTGLLPPPAMDWLDKRLFSSFRSTRLGPFKHPLRHLRRLNFFSVEVRMNRPLLPNHVLPQLRNAFVAVALFYCIWWNLSGTALTPKIPDGSRWFGYVLRLDQHWGMFAPTVFKDDGWYVLEGNTAKGAVIDLNQQGKAADTVKPASVMSLFKNDRWRKYSENYLFVHNSYMRPYYCNYLMRRWNEAHPQQQIKHLDVVYMLEPSLPDYQVATPKREVLCSCANQPE
ncbi:HTTM domain-containing protein [Pontibacter akesuensis]|uniref:Vitamin K-dependent gamma-carboxylase n=1 Tax=Pontibacter akesuensis TaxID=388950 RepID=A0A1I7IGI7_9BACT|nr:HTTM domain-containing protein [Pontibacter akesuensis]GHA67073.1 HTTM domain-containing protein [Pontibacter akesuensis]SFU72053.1 Vitamin K-dependent gamma-carboxylase [Pontibacter akesuensis]